MRVAEEVGGHLVGEAVHEGLGIGRGAGMVEVNGVWGVLVMGVRRWDGSVLEEVRRLTFEHGILCLSYPFHFGVVAIIFHS